MPTELIGVIAEGTREELRTALLHAYSAFAVYRDQFHELGLTRDDLQVKDPVAVLQSIPPLRGEMFHDLTDESIVRADEVVDIETSSGTTGRRKRRIITYADDASENELLVRLFGICGIDASDRVACVDIGPLTLMVSFTRALDALGVREAYAYSVSPDVESSVEGLFRLEPTVVITVPSILDRHVDGLRVQFATSAAWRLRKLLYVGEPLAEGTRAVLSDELGLEVLGYYGASETSALGIECLGHDGVHLFNDRNVLEIAGTGPRRDVGELLVTTLRQEGLPLVRYALSDLVEVRPGHCRCGLPYPRVRVIGRTDGTATVLGVKVSRDSIREAAYWGLGEAGPIEVVLSGNGLEKMTVVLPDRIAADERKVRKSLATREPDLAYLVGGKYIELELAFVDEAHFRGTRKSRSIVDLRDATNDGHR